MLNLSEQKELFESPDASKILDWLEDINTKLLKELLGTGIETLAAYLEQKLDSGFQLRLTLQKQNEMSNDSIIAQVTREIYAPSIEFDEEIELTAHEKERLSSFYIKYLNH